MAKVGIVDFYDGAIRQTIGAVEYSNGGGVLRKTLFSEFCFQIGTDPLVSIPQTCLSFSDITASIYAGALYGGKWKGRTIVTE